MSTFYKAGITFLVFLIFHQTITAQPLTVNITGYYDVDCDCPNGYGGLNATALGGTGPYTYLWSNGSTLSSINSLLPGIYTVTVTDAVLSTATNLDSINSLPTFWANMSFIAPTPGKCN